jgi:hypothetical protein
MSAFCACTVHFDGRVIDREETCPRHSYYRICSVCGHGHGEDIGCPDHSWRDACPYYGLGCVSDAS